MNNLGCALLTDCDCTRPQFVHVCTHVLNVRIYECVKMDLPFSLAHLSRLQLDFYHPPPRALVSLDSILVLNFCLCLRSATPPTRVCEQCHTRKSPLVLAPLLILCCCSHQAARRSSLRRWCSSALATVRCPCQGCPSTRRAPLCPTRQAVCLDT